MHESTTVELNRKSAEYKVEKLLPLYMERLQDRKEEIEAAVKAFQEGDFLTAEAKALSASIYLQGFMDVLHGFGRNMTVLRWEKGEASHD